MIEKKWKFPHVRQLVNFWSSILLGKTSLLASAKVHPEAFELKHVMRGK